MLLWYMYKSINLPTLGLEINIKVTVSSLHRLVRRLRRPATWILISRPCALPVSGKPS